MRYRVSKGQVNRALRHGVDTHFLRFGRQEEIKRKVTRLEEGKKREEPHADTRNVKIMEGLD